MKTIQLNWQDLPGIEILGIPVTCLDREEMLSIVQDTVQGAAPGRAGVRTWLTYVNAHCLNTATRDPAYKAALHAADLVYTDGVGVVWASRILSGCRLTKLTGADWLFDFCQRAAAQGWRVYLLGGAPGIARVAAEKLCDRFPGLQVVGARDGYLKEEEQAALLDELNSLQPDVLLVGMGVPRQDLWVAQRREALRIKVAWSIGALLDYVAGEEQRAPQWMRKLPLEWLWRLWMDPLGKWQRYLVGNPLFILRVLRQKWFTG